MSSSRLGELEETTALLHQEVARLRQENAEVTRLRQENGKLQERNVQLAAELSVRNRELELSLTGSGRNLSRQQSNGDAVVYSDVSDEHEGVPGDSFPAVAASLDNIDSDTNTDVEDTGTEDPPIKKNYETDYVLQKLGKGGNRMEQIKRQLVVQRGAIVVALKILAQSRSSSGSMVSFKSSESNNKEQDRALASITTEHTVPEDTSKFKLCPMCEAMFPEESMEEFEQHVMDHFSYDSEQETLQYFVPEGETEGQL
eukprot:GFUD01035165.1.p1 GENE.GFUD01035165.1~~GFUD01035165.1.p1  ORF type:complete len:257 (-),score=98.45 GFUD01035165.1:96-866(-)